MNGVEPETEPFRIMILWADVGSELKGTGLIVHDLVLSKETARFEDRNDKQPSVIDHIHDALINEIDRIWLLTSVNDCITIIEKLHMEASYDFLDEARVIARCILSDLSHIVEEVTEALDNVGQCCLNHLHL